MGTTKVGRLLTYFSFSAVIGGLNELIYDYRAVGRSENPKALETFENPGVQVLFGGPNLPPLG